MYLKRLEMRGFKSFADKTYIDFDNGVTCIVGPNGSGKSNITDAVRWVLGEQRAKTLRGSKMEDIIFNGTQHRKKLGMSEVSLIFDNSERFFPLDFNEVKVCRRVYRSGESEYLLNDTNCRLRDVKDLFMDTGIGTDGYSIIGQGRIESVLSNNMDERRLLFEEAAGIVKYKTRKRDTERKLENTELNLVRIEDIFNELGTRVEPLRIESEKAKRHIELTDMLSELELNLFINEIEAVDKKIEKEVYNINESTIALDLKNKSKEELFAKKNNFNEKIEKSTHDLQNIKNSFYEDKNEISNIEGEINVFNTKVESSKENKSRLKVELHNNEKKFEEIENNLSAVALDKANLENELESISIETRRKNDEFNAVSKSLYEGQLASEKNRDKVIHKLNDIEKKKAEIQSYKTILINHLSRKDQLFSEIKDAEQAMAGEKKKEGHHLNKLHDLLAREKNLLEDNKAINDQLNTIEKSLNKEGLIINGLRKKLTELTTENALLKQMEKEHAGFDHSVKKALQMSDNSEKFSGISGVVASLMTIPKKYETALEVALGKSIQNIVTETPEDAKAMIKELKRTRAGRVTFIPLSGIEAKGDQNNTIEALKKISGYIGKANHLFDYEAKYTTLYDYLVGRTVVVSDVEAATEALKINNLKYKLVTLEGDVFIPGGTITGGSYKSRNAGILSRKRKISDLDKKIIDSNDAIKTLSDVIDELRACQKTKLIDLDENKKMSEFNRLELAKEENEINSVKNQLNQLMTLVSKRKSESNLIEADIKTCNDAITVGEADIELIQGQVKQIETDVLTVNSDLELMQASMQNLREQLTDVKVKNASLHELYKSVEATVKRLISERAATLNAIKLTTSLINDTKELINALEASIAGLRIRKKAIVLASSGKDEQIKSIQDTITSFVDKIKTINKNNKDLFDGIEQLKEILHKYDIRKAKLDVHREDIAERLFERYEMSPEDAMKCKKDIDMANANKEIKSIRSELKGIGDVSLASIEAYAEVSERYLFLKTQHDDLIEARNGLRKLIKELEKVMVESFVACFEQVKINFAEIFESLFIGGKAEIKIMDTENVLDSDIGIDIQPPGKKLQNISLLSGGEKALTAIALLFAILKTKPAPFCILDEIEAALDDINVYRFADFLKEFTKSSQFVIITHRKGTMEIADNLFGVTMQEFGISKMISVRLEDAILE